jgi:hypothetical protein
MSVGCGEDPGFTALSFLYSPKPKKREENRLLRRRQDRASSAPDFARRVRTLNLERLIHLITLQCQAQNQYTFRDRI